MNNIIERVWHQNKMVKIEDLRGMAFQAEAAGHTFQISGVDKDGNALALSGTVSGVFLRPDNTDVAITGAASGGVVSVTLPAECYDVPGRFGLTVYVSANGEKVAVYAAMGTVSRASSGTVSPGTVGDVVDLINRINAAVQTIPASWSGLIADIAPTYSDTAVYPLGAYVYYDGDLYRSTAAITTAETFNTGNWVKAVLGKDVGDLTSAIINCSVVADLTTFTINRIRPSDGATLTSDIRLASDTNRICGENLVGFYAKPGYKYVLYCYSVGGPVAGTYLGYYCNGSYIKQSTIESDAWLTGLTFIPFKDLWYRVLVGRVDDGEITVEEADNIVFYCCTDDSLSVFGKAADAKVTGDKISENREIINAHNVQTAVEIGEEIAIQNWYMTIVDGKVTASIQAKMFYIPCVKNTLYRIDHPKSGRFIVGCFDSVPAVGSIPTKYTVGTSGNISEDSTFISTESSTVYLGVYYFSNNYSLGYTAEEAFQALAVYSNAVDVTLSKDGIPADAKATGDKISERIAEVSAEIGDFYRVHDDTALVNTYDGVIGLYDALVTSHPNFVTKNTLSSGELTNYEYILTIGNYNTSGKRSRDPIIVKPKILITSGVHGYEQSAVMSLYRFIKSLCENAYQLNDVIDFPELHVIPIVCPWGYTNNSRVNENGVNINRNFDTSDWTQTSTGSDYSGATPGDQDETKIVQNWIIENNDAVIYIDWHNSNFANEISCLLGSADSDSMSIKKNYLYGINHVIPYWQKKRGIGAENIYGYTGTSSTAGTAKTYGNEHGITSFTFETSWDVASSGKHSAFSIATGAEAFGNMLKGIRDILL